jgi:hypothetical protein
MDPVRQKPISGGVHFSSERARDREHQSVISGNSCSPDHEGRCNPEWKAASVHQRFSDGGAYPKASEAPRPVAQYDSAHVIERSAGSTKQALNHREESPGVAARAYDVLLQRLCVCHAKRNRCLVCGGVYG